MTGESGPKIAVIGGGCAGLAAAAKLAENNIPVTLYEASPHLGGRARGVQWNDQQLDNGQHILLGAYSETLKLLNLAGVDCQRAMLHIPLRLIMQGEMSLQAPRKLPAPLHIIAAFMLAKGLSWRERIAIVQFMAWLKLAGFALPHDEPLLGFLQRKHQPERIIRLIWEPLCLAALNTPIAEASAQVFLNVLRDSFSKARADSDMLLPRCDLSTLLAEPVSAFIKEHGGTVEPGTTVSGIIRTSRGLCVNMENSSTTFSHVVLAVPAFRVASLINHLPETNDIAGLVAQFEYQPIYTVYLQYPESTKLEVPMLGLVSRHPGQAHYSQWVFDRGQLCSQPGLLAVVISAEGAHQQLSQQELAQSVIQELSAAFPHLPAPVWHKVIAEKRATFACKAGLRRPRYTTSVPGLYLAGDYTADGIIGNMYPATIEGAVRSGIQCANHILTDINE